MVYAVFLMTTKIRANKHSIPRSKYVTPFVNETQTLTHRRLKYQFARLCGMTTSQAMSLRDTHVKDMVRFLYYRIHPQHQPQQATQSDIDDVL